MASEPAGRERGRAGHRTAPGRGGSEEDSATVLESSMPEASSQRGLSGVGQGKRFKASEPVSRLEKIFGYETGTSLRPSISGLDKICSKPEFKTINDISIFSCA